MIEAVNPFGEYGQSFGQRYGGYARCYPDRPEPGNATRHWEKYGHAMPTTA